MYARVTSFQSDPSRIDEMNEIRESMKSGVAAVAGLTIAIGAWNDDGSGSVTAVYESQEAAQDQIASIWEKWQTCSRHHQPPLDTQTWTTCWADLSIR